MIIPKAEITEEQEGILRWLRATVSRGLDRPICVTTNYRENSPVYFGDNLDEILELASEDYADWDEGLT